MPEGELAKRIEKLEEEGKDFFVGVQTAMGEEAAIDVKEAANKD